MLIISGHVYHMVSTSAGYFVSDGKTDGGCYLSKNMYPLGTTFQKDGSHLLQDVDRIIGIAIFIN